MPQKTHDKVKEMHRQDEDLANLTIYLDERRFPQDKKHNIQNIEIESQFVCDRNGLLFRHINIGKRSVN